MYSTNKVSPSVLKYFQDESMDDEVRRRLIIQRLTSTIIVEYDYKLKKSYIDPYYREFIGFELGEEHFNNIEWLNKVAYRPHIPMLIEFFNLSGEKETCSRTINVRLLAASGAFEWYRLSIICYIDENGEKKFLVLTISNVDSEITAQKELEFLAESDQLTRVPNKDTFIVKTKELLAKNPKTMYVLIRADIERFRTINQLYGSVEGNNILKYIAVKIQEYVEAEGDGLYCRLESDVFGICMPYNKENINELEIYIQDALKIYPLKFEIKTSFGYYVIDDPDTPIETMFDRAFAAQKQIKGSFVKHSAYYNDELKRKEAIEQKIIMEMRGALESGQFHIYLQPKCDMNTGEIVGSEELVRWIHPEQGIISPGDFIPVFEKNGFISELDHYILENCCQTIRKWMDNDMPIHPISVNISRTDLYDPKLFDKITKTVDSYGIPHEYIEFELTESSFVLDNAQLMSLNNMLREHGFRVLMDDFGSGYSSLNSLKELNVDVLKIDLKFLPTSNDDTRARAILSAVVNMAKKLGMDIVVEGVETDEQAKFLLEIGCSVAQGYYYFKPMPINDYEGKL